MFIEHNFPSDGHIARNDEARSIGSVINGMREVAALREKARWDRNFLNFAATSHPARAPRLRALRGNSA